MYSRNHAARAFRKAGRATGKDMAIERAPVTNAKPATAKLPPAYKRIEDNMASHFSTRVKIRPQENRQGNILIEFYNDEDLERIMDKMNL